MRQPVTINPDLLTWARERAGLDPDALARALKKPVDLVLRWENEGTLPLASLNKWAEKTHTPIGYLFASTPPEERLPISDFRTRNGAAPAKPSVDLIDTIYTCQRRQDWFSDFIRNNEGEPLPFVGSVSLTDDPAVVASDIRKHLDLNSTRLPRGDSSDVLRELVRRCESIGILVLRNTYVGNTKRKLNPQEFRGFALSDLYAPLIFINTADSRAACIFTLVHELAHIWLGESGISDVSLRPRAASERFCNAVAAETLVPMADFRKAWNEAVGQDRVTSLAARFSVSRLVVLIRAKDSGLLPEATFEELYQDAKRRAEDVLDRAIPSPETKGGTPTYYTMVKLRAGRPLIKAVIESVREGTTTYTEAFRLLDIKGTKQLDALARKVGMA